MIAPFASMLSGWHALQTLGSLEVEGCAEPPLSVVGGSPWQLPHVAWLLPPVQAGVVFVPPESVAPWQ
jgi:hypothetical protein